MNCSFAKIAFTWLVASCASGVISITTAKGQVVEHRDFDVVHVGASGAHTDGVDRSLAIARIVKGTNGLRREHDRSQLKTNEKLAAVAQELAQYMARTDRYGHQADDRTPAERVSAHGYEYCLLAENIAMRHNATGYETERLARGFVEGWVESPEHKKNMLDADVTEIGVGLAMSDQSGRYYAVQVFGRPKSEAIDFAITNRAVAELEYELGEQTFSLPAGMTRTHSRCRPPELKVHLPEQPLRTLAVKRGSRYVVERGADGKLGIAVGSDSARQ